MDGNAALCSATICFAAFCGTAILCIWREMLHRGDLLSLRDYIEDLSHNAGMDYAEVMRCAIGYINKLIGDE